MTNIKRPALVRCDRGSSEVTARPVALVDGSYALVASAEYRVIGALRHRTVYVSGLARTSWYATDGAGSELVPHAASKEAALRLLLEALSITPITMNDTIPDLLAGLD